MSIEQSSSGGEDEYVLDDGRVQVDVTIRGETLSLRSEDVNFVEMAKREAEGFQPEPEEFVDAVADGLDLVLDSVEVVDVVAHEAAFTVTEDSIVIAGTRWDGPQELYPG